eukprot:gene13409-biopygen10715
MSVRRWKGEKSTKIGVNLNEEMIKALLNLLLYGVEDTPKRKDDYDDLSNDELAVKSAKRKGDDESVVKSSKRKRPSNMKLSIEKLSNHKIQEAYSAILLNYISRKAKEYCKKCFKSIIDPHIEHSADFDRKYAWVKPLKRKTSGEIVGAFQDILLERRPQKVRSDKGSEFMNEDFQELLKKDNIEFYTANNKVKAAIVERFNRTLKGRMY